jgi:HD-GYP domain-containing protein (c-di-GMP phosphodiesterase class II)
MGKATTTASIRRLPGVVAATVAVFGLPVPIVYALRASGAVDSLILLVAIGTALSVATSSAGAALWAARSGGGDTVFDDLMLWGWLRRRRQERLLASAERLLASHGGTRAGAVPRSGPGSPVKHLKRLAAALEARDPYTYGHARRVARHATAVAKRMGLPRAEVARIRTAASVHDVGKVEIPLEIVQKPGSLSDEEFAAVKRHSAAGAELVADLGDEKLTRIVRHHHERFDGSGYPDGLAGERIPLGARIIAVADTFDAITSTRPYRPARPHKEALKLLSSEAGAQLDPDAVRAFRAHYSGLRAVALSALAFNGPRQLLASLVDELRLGGAAVAAKGAAVTAVAAAAGSVVADAPKGNAEPADGAKRAAAQRAFDRAGAARPTAAGATGGRSISVRVEPGAASQPGTGAARPLSPAGGGQQPGEPSPGGGSGGDAPGNGPTLTAVSGPVRVDEPAHAVDLASNDEETKEPTEPVATVDNAAGKAEPSPVGVAGPPAADRRPESPKADPTDLGA